MEENVRIETCWKEEYYAELEEATYLHSDETVKKGGNYDILTLLCGVFALTCFVIVSYFGITGSFTKAMVVLLICYFIIGFWCFCMPLQCAVSRMLWGINFAGRFPINKGCDPEIEISVETLLFKNKKGKKVIVSMDDMTSIYETKNCVVFHSNDNEIFAIDKHYLKETGLDEKLFIFIVYDKDSVDYEDYDNQNYASAPKNDLETGKNRLVTDEWQDDDE